MINTFECSYCMEGRPVSLVSTETREDTGEWACMYCTGEKVKNNPKKSYLPIESLYAATGE